MQFMRCGDRKERAAHTGHWDFSGLCLFAHMNRGIRTWIYVTHKSVIKTVNILSELCTTWEMITERHQCLFYRYCLYHAFFNSLWIHLQVFFFLNVCSFLAVLCLRCSAWASPWWHLLLWSRGSRLKALGLLGSGAHAWWLWCVDLDAPWCVGSSQIRDWTCVSCTDRLILYHWAIREGPPPPFFNLKLANYWINLDYRLWWWDWQTT